MIDDPIVVEVHETREKLVAKFGGNLHAYLADVMRRQEAAKAAGQEYVSLPPRRFEPVSLVASARGQ